MLFSTSACHTHSNWGVELRTEKSMKKLSTRFKRWLLQRAHNQQRRNNFSRIMIQKSSGRELWRRHFIEEMSREERDEVFIPYVIKYGKRIIPPENFCLDENLNEVSEFMQEFRTKTKNLLGIESAVTEKTI